MILTDPHVHVVPPEKLVLDSGRPVWIRVFDEEVQPIKPELVPIGQLVRVLTPEADEVSCPGSLVVGVNVA